MKPVVDRLKQKYAGKVEFRRLDANSNDPEIQQLANAFGVQYVPTFEFIDKSGHQVDQVVGEITEQALSQKLDALK